MRGVKLRNADTLADWSVGIAAQTGAGTVKALLDSKAPSIDPTFTGTVNGITSNMVAFTPAAGISSTNLQGALVELAVEKLPVTGTTGSAVLPTGTTAERDDSPAVGYIRFNSTTGQYEGYTGSAWKQLAGATGAGSDQVFVENDQVITTSYTITAGKNASSAGPITISDGVVVTVPSGSSWVIV